jgi:hypothetical protein
MGPGPTDVMQQHCMQIAGELPLEGGVPGLAGKRAQDLPTVWPELSLEICLWHAPTGALLCAPGNERVWLACHVI